MDVNTRIFALSPVSECSLPGPWQVSQAEFSLPAGARSFFALPCCVDARLLASLSWQAMHVSSPTYSSFAGTFGVDAVWADGPGGCGFPCAANSVAAHKGSVARRIHFIIGQWLCTGNASYSIA